MRNYYPLSHFIAHLFAKLTRPVLLLLIISFIWSSPSKASHYSAGEIFYQWIGNEPGKDSLTYRVFATIFRNTSGAGIGTGNLNGCAFRKNDPGNSSISLTLNYQSPSSALNPKFLLTASNPYGWRDVGAHPSDGTGWNTPNLNQCASSNKTISEYRYVGEVTLTSKASDWLLNVNTPCCRDQNDNLASGGNLFLSAALNNRNGPNSSPRVTNFIQFALCVISDTTRPFRLNFGARDGNGDSLVYQLDPDGPLESSGFSCNSIPTKLGFTTPFTASNPFLTHRPPRFNQRTGQFIFAPSQAGSYVVKAQVQDLRPNANGTFIVVGETVVEFQMQISSACRASQTNFIATPPKTINADCGDSTFTVSTSEQFDKFTLEPGASDFALLTSQNTLLALKAVQLQNNRSDFQFTLNDTIGINDTMHLVARTGLDSNTVFNVCGIQYKDFDTLATVISSGCKIDTTSGVGLAQFSAEHLSLYPNPASNFVQFKSPVSLNNSNYQLINSTGAIVREAALQGDKRIFTANLRPGVYWIRLQHQDFTVVKKFIKE